ncbi:hypothetical protein BH20ACT3_BH20ACT3_01990 [soil metagenome]
MNGLLWLGVACTVILILAMVLDGADEAFDALDLGPPWLSLPVLAAFLGAFGFVSGAFIDRLGPVALGLGVAAGVGFGVGAVRFSSSVMDMPTDRTEAAADLLASFGRVVTPASPDRYGEVMLDRPSGPVKVSCTAAEALPMGTEVVVVDVTSSTLVTVEPFDPNALSS